MDEPRRPTEEERALSWREERFRELGFDDEMAALLAEYEVSWWAAKALLDDGCDPRLVVEILT